MVQEAELDRTAQGTIVTSDGWFALHASEASWKSNDRFGAVCFFENGVRFPDLGINLHVIAPGQPACLYHAENAQEDFFVLSGECVLLVEEQERRLKAGYFVHCPAGTRHVFIGAGEGPCTILMVGARKADHTLLYPVSEAAARHGASVREETTDPRQAYGRIPLFDTPVVALWPAASD